MKIVKAGYMPGTLGEVAVEDNATVAQVLEIAELSAEGGYEIRVNNTVASLTDIVPNNALLVLVKQVKGNN